MVANVKEKIGLGIYTPAEAARYARVHTATLARWIHGDDRGRAVVDAQLSGDQDRIITFLDFVQALAIRAIRTRHRLPLSKIRDAVSYTRQRLGLTYPLARKHTTYLFRGDLYVRLETENEEEFITDYMQVSGIGKDQLAHAKVIELYMENLSFDATGLASTYRPFEYKDRVVVMDPQRRFGQPMLDSCAYTIEALIGAVDTEGGIDAAAAAYGVEREDVLAAIAYDDYLRGPSA